MAFSYDTEITLTVVLAVNIAVVTSNPNLSNKYLMFLELLILLFLIVPYPAIPWMGLQWHTGYYCNYCYCITAKPS